MTNMASMPDRPSISFNPLSAPSAKHVVLKQSPVTDASDMIVTSESPLSYGYPVDGFRI